MIFSVGFWKSPVAGAHRHALPPPSPATKDDFKLNQGFDFLYEQPDEGYKELFLQIWRRSALIE